jgi:hypothetical protein
MNDLRKLAQAVRCEIPGADLEIEEPTRSRQSCWLDIAYQTMWIAVEWKPGIGFGVSRLEVEDDPATGLFEGPDEVFEDWREVKEHILLWLQSPGLTERRQAVRR